MKRGRGSTLRRLSVAAAGVVAALAAAATASAETLYGVTAANTLVKFSSTAPGAIPTTLSITGLAVGDVVAGIDCRPATGQLFVITNSVTAPAPADKLYTVDPVTGVATQVGAAFTLTGGFPGFDVNPMVDLIRVVSETDENFRLNPSTGAVTPDTSLAFAALDPNAGTSPTINGLAYTNNVPSAGSTALYGIDSNQNILVSVPNPNAGLLTTVGSLGVDTSAIVGFDVSPSGTAYAALNVGGLSALYTIDLATGAATLVGAFGTQLGSVTLVGLTAACGALPVELYSFTAQRRASGVLVRWRTASESRTLGFNVFRQTGTKRVRLNRTLVPAQALTRGGLAGGDYRFVDRRAPRGRALRYWLQVVDVGGRRTWHGPLGVRPAGA